MGTDTSRQQTTVIQCMLLSVPYGSSGVPPASDPGDAAAGSAPPLLPVLRLPGEPLPVLTGSSSCAPRRNSSPRAPPAGTAASSGADLAPVHRPCCSVGDAAAAARPLVSDEYCPDCRLAPAAPLLAPPARCGSDEAGSGVVEPDAICQLGVAAAAPKLSLLSLSAVALPVGSAAALRPGLLPSLPAALAPPGLLPSLPALLKHPGLPSDASDGHEWEFAGRWCRQSVGVSV
jgi:hypothetical protein